MYALGMFQSTFNALKQMNNGDKNIVKADLGLLLYSKVALAIIAKQSNHTITKDGVTFVDVNETTHRNLLFLAYFILQPHRHTTFMLAHQVFRNTYLKYKLVDSSGKVLSPAEILTAVKQILSAKLTSIQSASPDAIRKVSVPKIIKAYTYENQWKQIAEKVVLGANIKKMTNAVRQLKLQASETAPGGSNAPNPPNSPVRAPFTPPRSSSSSCSRYP
jgi:hypothetical protein